MFQRKVDLGKFQIYFLSIDIDVWCITCQQIDVNVGCFSMYPDVGVFCEQAK